MPHVLIVGAGPGGASLAHLLAHRGTVLSEGMIFGLANRFDVRCKLCHSFAFHRRSKKR